MRFTLACNALVRCNASPARKPVAASRVKNAVLWNRFASGDNSVRSLVHKRWKLCQATCASSVVICPVRCLIPSALANSVTLHTDETRLSLHLAYHRDTSSLLGSFTQSATRTLVSTFHTISSVLRRAALPSRSCPFSCFAAFALARL